LTYLHSEVADLDPQIFNPLGEGERRLVLQKWNALFRSDLPRYNSVDGRINIKARRISLKQLRFLRFVSRFTPFGIALLMQNPRIITDKFPNALILARQMFIDLKSLDIRDRESKHIKIVMHIRQGELALSQFADRYLPLIHFENVLAKLIPILVEEGYTFTVRIPREELQEVLLDANDPKVKLSLLLNPNNHRVVLISNGFVKIEHEQSNTQETPHLHSAEWMEPLDTYSDFLEMLSADILVLSKSSLSFVAGLLNSNSVKIFVPFWHPTPDDWINSESIDAGTIQRILKNRHDDRLN
jgi:hypothetical protein